MDYFWYTYICILGSIIGSFLNVCILRIPAKESIVFGRSHCMTCKKQLRFIHMIPVFSYLFLRGRCPYCKSKISAQYPLVEALTAILFLLSVIRYGFTAEAFLLCIFSCLLIVASGVDAMTMELPDSISLLIAAVSIIHLFVSPLSPVQALIGAFIVSVPMLIISLLIGGFGGGDIKLCAACGLYLGFPLTLFGFFSACILAAVYGVCLMAHKKATGKSSISFGPFLAAGFLFAALFGNTIVTWYLSLL